MRPAFPEEAGLFYAMPKEQDKALGCIGHVNIYFGSSGRSFYSIWCPRGPKEWNTADFRAELVQVVDTLRKSVLKSFQDMGDYCRNHGGEISGGLLQDHGFVVDTERYRYMLVCSPHLDDHHAFLTCFDKQIQEMNQEQRKYPPEQGMTMGGM